MLLFRLLFFFVLLFFHGFFVESCDLLAFIGFSHT